MVAFVFAPPPASPQAERLRGEIREFLASELRERSAQARAGSWGSRDPDFSRKMGARGWIGMTWPKRYGGHERTALERYVVLEEVLAAGAPMGAHWVADRQSGPLLLRFGTEEQRQTILPRIAAGDCYFCIGMSEPDSGSDLAATRTRAVAVQGGFLVNGTKIWTSNAHQCHYVILFCRTELAAGADRHAGVSQFLVDLSLPGITIRPIYDLAGEHHFNEVVFEDVFLPADTLIGELGAGWRQVTSELAYERSGPERFLSTYVLLVELLRALGAQPSERAAVAAGRLTGHIMILRRLSRSVAGMLQAGEDPALQAALVKDLGTTLEQEIPEVARLLIEAGSRPRDSYDAVLAHAILRAPSFSIRGGTREILRGIVARGLGVR
jgi:alkylation response protein AidB-like acyl-CoA dehydrogenase